MLKNLSKFVSDDEGAVTVDFVVLTAAVTLMALLAFVGVRDQTVSTAGEAAQLLVDYSAEVRDVIE